MEAPLAWARRKCEWNPWWEEFIWFIRRRWQPIFHYALAYYFCWVCKDLHPRVVYQGCSVLHPRVFPIGNPYLILKEGEGLSYIFSFQHFSKLIPSATALFCWAENVVLLGAATGGTHRVIPWLILQWRSCIFFGGAAEETLGHYFRSLVLGQTFTISHSAI